MRRIASIAIIGAVGIGAVYYTQHGAPAWFDRLRYPLRYGAIVRAGAGDFHLEPALLAAVIYQESKFRPDVRSSSGAVGLMQLLPSTARGIAVHTGGSRFRVSDLYNPEINIRYGCWYLRHLLDKYHDETLALAAYNAGQTNVDTWRREGRGIVFPETRDYVHQVEHLKHVYQHAYGLT